MFINILVLPNILNLKRNAQPICIARCKKFSLAITRLFVDIFMRRRFIIYSAILDIKKYIS